MKEIDQLEREIATLSAETEIRTRTFSKPTLADKY